MKNSLALALLVASFALPGCATTDLPTSGLFGDYGAFERRGPDMLVQRVASAEELARYRRVRVDRVHLYLAPGSAGRALPVGVQRSLATSLRDALRDELGAHYDLIQDIAQLTPDTLRVRATITDVQPSDRETREVGSATVELEIVDAPALGQLARTLALELGRDAPDELEARGVH